MHEKGGILEHFKPLNTFKKNTQQQINNWRLLNLSGQICTSFLLIALVGITACTHKKTDSHINSIDSKDASKLISNQPTPASQGLFLIEFKNPALLENAIDGKVDANRKTELLAEQAEMEKKLLELSPDIKIIYRYKLLLNGFYIFAPTQKEQELRNLSQISRISMPATFQRPAVKIETANDSGEVSDVKLDGPTSVDFIGANVAHQKGFTGKGVKVGVIDTGIDYTHAMLGGSGNASDYKNMDPTQKSNLFPNSKVVGGIDLVGTDYDSGSTQLSATIPIPDDNPIDEGGHGTHVAGTIAGVGDQVHSYSGVAPDASLYAIKVFGKKGSTSDATVIAALEYAMDPNGDLDTSDKLDVVNLSLGGDYGTPQASYKKAIHNASMANLMVVAAAGNSGYVPYIVGSPGTNDESLSVAATIDNMKHNISFDALKVSSVNAENVSEIKNIEYVESAISKKLTQISSLVGKPVFIGLGDKVTDEQKAAVKGNIALIDRGIVAFAVKIKTAQEAGAIAAIVVNNQDGDPFVMGGEGAFDIPAIMIDKVSGSDIKNKLSQKIEVTIDFKSGVKIEKPELIDTLTDFSSQGPRAFDSAIKPEIAAPGSAIISAAMGKGNDVVKMSGTSMATPHMAGVIALLKQKNKNMGFEDLKSLVMGTSKVISDKNKKTYPIAMQGAGRVQLDKAIATDLVINPSSLSLGELQIGLSKVLRKQIEIKNNSDQVLNLKVTSQLQKGLQLQDQAVVLAPKSSKKLNIDIKIIGDFITETATELDGRILVKNGEETIQQVPLMAIVSKASELRVKSLQIMADSESTSDGALTQLTIENQSLANSGVALPFILLGQSEREKATSALQSQKSSFCDLESVGYRIVDKQINGVNKKILQVAVKTYTPVTSWNFCEPNVQLDSDEDGIPEQELAGIFGDNVPGIGGKKFASALFDAHQLKKLRLQYEKDLVSTDQKTKENAKEDYSTALIDALPIIQYDHSTLVVLQADISQLVQTMGQTLRIKVGIQSYESDAILPFDFLDRWINLDTNNGLSFKGLPESISVSPHQSETVEFTKGAAHDPLVIYFPQNQFTTSHVGNDEESEVVTKAIFGANN